MTENYPGKNNSSFAMLFQLFMVFVFPFHVWSFLMAFRDFDWVAKRTEVWDAVGLVSYALVFALVETIAFFLIMLLLGTLIPRRWQEDKRIALLGTLGLSVATWAILYQAYFLLEDPMPPFLYSFLLQIAHPLRVLWTGAALLVLLSVGIPVYLILRFTRTQRILIGIFDRIAVVSSIYLVFDIAGIIVILIRNLRV